MLNARTSRKLHFNQKALARFPAHTADSPSRDQEYSDSEVIGLKLLVSKTGRKFFYFRYCFNNRKRAIKVGEFPMMTIKQARQIAGQHRNSINLGVDPHCKPDESKDNMSFEDYALNEYIPFVKTEKKTWNQDLSKLHFRVFKVFGKYPLSSITNRDVQKFISGLKKELSASSANRFLSLLSRMFNLAVQWEFMANNPCKGIAKARETGRERFLPKEEIKKLLSALDEANNQIAANAIKLLLFTGTRHNEVMTLKWENVNLENKSFYLPDTKNGTPRTVVLNELAMGILELMKTHKQVNNPYVFPSLRKSAEGHIVDPKKVFHCALKKAGIANFRMHDLRHTYASILINNGVSLYEVKELLGHKDISVTQRYSHLQNSSLREATSNVASVINGLD
jgi:integrase